MLEFYRKHYMTNNVRDNRKPIGIGTVSFLFAALAFFWSAEFGRGICLGDHVLQKIGLPSWTNGSTGFHLTLLYSLVFLIPAFILANKYPDHLLAKTSKAISWIGILALLSLLILISFI